jgi:1-acyl-sn-glycerol-3-phosphate acyltransferase
LSDKRNQYQLTKQVRIFRWMLRPIFRVLFHVISDVRISGLENIPADGAYIIAINHISIIEPPFIIAFWPIAPEAVGAKEIWERKGQSLLAKLYGGIQVHRNEFDRQVIDKMIEVVASGRPLLIAPEGGRSHTPGMRKAYPGVAYIAARSRAPIVPVGIIGSTSDFLREALRFKRPVLEMNIGIPMELPVINGKGMHRRFELQKNSDLIMYKLAELLPPNYQGVYATGKSNPSETPQ